MHPSTWRAYLALILLLAACSGSGGDTTPLPNPTPSPGDGAVELTCDGFGFACSPDEVPAEVLTRSSLLNEEAQARLANEESFSDVRDWLESQPDMRLVLTGDRALAFILEGGIPIALYHPFRADDDAQPDSDARIAESQVVLQDVVGHDTNRDNPGNKKKALVLSPFEFEYRVPDVGTTVWGMLTGIDDYQGGGTAQYFANEDVTVDKFGTWNDYDVIVYNGHGGEISAFDSRTQQRVSTSFLTTGVRVDSCDAPEVKAAGEGVSCSGVLVRYETESGDHADHHRNFLTIWPNYLTGMYPDGLEKAVVVLNACKSTLTSALPEKLAGDSSVVFGWTEDVLSGFNPGVITRFFELLSSGLPSERAYDITCQEGCIDTRGKGATLTRHTGGDDLRIREITTMKNPMRPGVGSQSSTLQAEDDLATGDALPFLGQAEDGENDTLLLYVDVEGVESGRESSYDVRIAVADEEIGTWSLDSDRAERVDEYTVRLRIEQPLDFDVQKGQAIELEAKTSLPEEGESPHRVSPVLANPVLRFDSTIRSEAAGSGFTMTGTVEAEIPLFLKKGATPDELEVDASVDVLEYVSFEVTVPTCSATTQTKDGRLEVKRATIPLDEPESADFGVPEELVLVVYPEIREVITVTCPGGSENLDQTHWFAGFMSIHAGAFDGVDEFDESEGGFLIQGWERGSGDVYARKVYQRDYVDGEITVTEDTTLEVRGPSF